MSKVEQFSSGQIKYILNKGDSHSRTPFHTQDQVPPPGASLINDLRSSITTWGKSSQTLLYVRRNTADSLRIVIDCWHMVTKSTLSQACEGSAALLPDRFKFGCLEEVLFI
jgi:hypothetical protein